MGDWSILKKAIASVIKTNGNQEITGQLLQNTLNNIVSSIGENATFAGVATPGTNPGVPDGPVFYWASTKGVYPNFEGLEVSDYAIILVRTNAGWKSISTGVPLQNKIVDIIATEIALQSSAWLSRLQGASENSDASLDPFISLGNFSSSYGTLQKALEAFNNTIDGICGSADDVSKGQKYSGRIRASIYGINVEIHQYAESYAAGSYLQTISGNVAVNLEGRITTIPNHFTTLVRHCDKWVWDSWRPAYGTNSDGQGGNVEILSTNPISVDTNSTGAKYIGLRTGQSLSLDDYGRLQVKVGKGIRLWTDPDQNYQVGDVRINIDPTKDGLEFANDTRLAVRVGKGIEKTSEGISVKLSTGLEFDDAGAIVATSGKATTETVTVTEKIPVAGGPLSQLLNDAGIMEVNADTNLQDLFVSLLAKEIWPVATYRGGSITASISVPSFSVSPTAYAEIGAAVSIGAIKATATTTTATDGVVSGLTYGYSLADDNTVDSKDTSIRSAATNIRPGNGTYLLTRVINGVSEESEDSDYANVSLPATTMTVKSGVNTIKVSIQGRGGACSYAAIDPVYICSNFGNTSQEHKYAGRAAITTLLSNTPSDSRTVTVRGVYPYFANAASNTTFDKQPLTDNRWIPANGASVSSAGLTFADEGPNKHAIKIPAIYALKSVKILNPNTGKFDDYAVSNFTESTESIDVQGQSVEYKVYTRNNNGFTGATTFKFEF